MGLLTPTVGEDYPVVASGDGAYLYTVDGRRYLDGSSGPVLVNIGHGVEEVIDALTEQARKLAYVYRGQAINEPALRLAQVIAAEWAPESVGNVWFSSGGSEAVEAAFRFARQYHVEQGQPARAKVISTWHSYHGSTLGALAASGRERPRASFQPYFAGSWPHIKAPYCYRCPYRLKYPECAIRCADELETAILHEGPENIAAFIIEPVVGTTTGGTSPPKEYFPRVREICDRHGVLLIVDEVMTGFGRTGKRFAIDHWGVIPDIIATGKGLGAGYAPIFATLVNDSIVGAIREGSREIGLGNTYNANPLSCAVGLAVLNYVTRLNLVERARILGDYLHDSLAGLLDLGVVGDVRGMGLMQGIEFVTDLSSQEPFPSEERVADRVRSACERRGLFIQGRTGTIDGVRGDHVFITPPLTSTESQLDEVVGILRASIIEVCHVGM